MHSHCLSPTVYHPRAHLAVPDMAGSNTMRSAIISAGGCLVEDAEGLQHLQHSGHGCTRKACSTYNTSASVMNWVHSDKAMLFGSSRPDCSQC